MLMILVIVGLLLPVTATAIDTEAVDAAISSVRTEAHGRSVEVIDLIYENSIGAKTLVSAGPAAVLPIEHALKDSSEEFTAKAILCMALGDIHSPRAIPIFKSIVYDTKENTFVRQMAAHGIAIADEKTVATLIEGIVEDRSLPLDVRTQVMGDLVMSGFQDIEWLRRIALGKIYSEKEDLDINEGAGIMWNAMRALGTSKNPVATDILIDLQSKNPVNDTLTQALRNRHDPKTIPVLLEVLVSTEVKVSLSKETAAAALADLKAEAAVDPLQHLISDSSDPLLIANLAEALGNIGDRRALPTLKNLVDGIDRDPRFEQYHSQEQMGYGPIPPIKRAMRKLSRE